MQSYYAIPKMFTLCPRYCIIIKIPNKRELQEMAMTLGALSIFTKKILRNHTCF